MNNIGSSKFFTERIKEGRGYHFLCAPIHIQQAYFAQYKDESIPSEKYYLVE